MLVNTHLTQRNAADRAAVCAFVNYQSQVVLSYTLGGEKWPSQAGLKVAKLVV